MREVRAVVLLTVPERMSTEDVRADLARSIEFGRPRIEVTDPARAVNAREGGNHDG